MGTASVPSATIRAIRSTRPRATRTRGAGSTLCCGGRARSARDRPGVPGDGCCQPAEQAGADGRRRPYTGRPADVAADIAAFGGAGVAHFFLSFSAATLAEALADLAWFAEEVRPLIR